MEISKKYLWHCVVWNVVGFLVSMGTNLHISGVYTKIWATFFIVGCAIMAIASFTLFVQGIYLLRHKQENRMHLIIGILVSTFFFLFGTFAVYQVFFAGMDMGGDTAPLATCPDGTIALTMSKCP